MDSDGENYSIMMLMAKVAMTDAMIISVGIVELKVKMRLNPLIYSFLSSCFAYVN